MKSSVIWALLALALTVPGQALAQSDPTAMQEAMAAYFRAERLGGVGFATAGTASLAAGGVLLASESDLARGMSYPMLGLGAVQLAVGSTVALSAGPRIRTFTKRIAESPGAYGAAEGKRMRGVNRTFRILFVTELALLAGGLAAGAYGLKTERDTLAGVGFGLSIQAALLLGQDTLASRRARRYTAALERFQIALSPGAQSYAVGYSGTW